MNFLTGFLYVILAVVVLLFMVLVHELGHYIAGRILKFKIEEFSIGFGKALFSRTNKRGEKISIRIFPLGGYCAFKGEGDDDEKPQPDAFNAQKPWKRIIVFFAGVVMNFLTAVIFSLILLCTIGYDVPQIKTNTLTVNGAGNQEVIFTSNALQEGDVVLSVAGTKVDFAFGDTFQNLIAKQQDAVKKWVEEGNSGEDYTFKITVRRDGKTQELDAKFNHVVTYKDDGTTVDSENYLLAITYSPYVYSFGEALGRCWEFAFGLAWVVLKTLWLLITFQLPLSSVGGPITTITTIASVTQTNWLNLLILIPMISANLAVFNILPFPALDGSHVLFTTIEWIRKKPIKRSVENMIHFIGLCILFGFVIIVDILHFVL